MNVYCVHVCLRARTCALQPRLPTLSFPELRLSFRASMRHSFVVSPIKTCRILVIFTHSKPPKSLSFLCACRSHFCQLESKPHIYFTLQEACAAYAKISINHPFVMSPRALTPVLHERLHSFALCVFLIVCQLKDNGHIFVEIRQISTICLISTLDRHEKQCLNIGSCPKFHFCTSFFLLTPAQSQHRKRCCAP